MIEEYYENENLHNRTCDPSISHGVKYQSPYIYIYKQEHVLIYLKHTKTNLHYSKSKASCSHCDYP